MFRSPALRAMTLAVTGVFALGATQALAAVQDIYQNASSTKREEKRNVLTGQTEEVYGAKELLETKPQVDEKILGSASKLIMESEIRSYRVPVRTHAVTREEKREVTTTTTNYIRRTTTQVVDQQWNVWMVGGYLREGHQFGSFLTYTPFRSNGDYRSVAVQMTKTGQHEQNQGEYDRANSVVVRISPHGEYGYLDAYLIFWRDGLGFMGGTIQCHGRDLANVRNAKILRYADHDAIQYQLNCALNEDPWGWTWCETDRTTWTVHLDRKLLEPQIRQTFRTETKDAPYSAVSNSYSAWVPTGVTGRGPAFTNPGLRYEPLVEKVLLRQHTVVNDAGVAKKLARSGNDVRKTFSADASSGKSQASLSGSKVRQTLGADRVSPSRVNTSKGGGAPDRSGGLPSLPLNLQPTPKPSPMPVSWWFPMNPQTPPPLVRYESYMNGI